MNWRPRSSNTAALCTALQESQILQSYAWYKNRKKRICSPYCQCAPFLSPKGRFFFRYDMPSVLWLYNYRLPLAYTSYINQNANLITCLSNSARNGHSRWARCEKERSGPTSRVSYDTQSLTYSGPVLLDKTLSEKDICRQKKQQIRGHCQQQQSCSQ